MANRVVDFEDIYSAVREELKIQSGDSVSLERIKRDINIGYEQEVVPYKRWWWLVKSTSIVHKAYYPVGASVTCSVTPDSTTVTLSTAPGASYGSFAGYKFSVDGFDEIYTISAHTSQSTTVTLSSSYQGALNATASFKIWRDTINLPTDCRETVEVRHDRFSKPVDPLGYQEMRRHTAAAPKAIGFPQYYNTLEYTDPTSGTDETESDRYRTMRLFPSITTENVTLHVDYTKEVSALEDDADEPIIPLEFRNVLVYWALFKAWTRERNPEAAAQSFQLFQRTLDRMAGNVQDGIDTPKLSPTSSYIKSKRGPRLRLGGRGAHFDQGTGGGGGFSQISYLTDVTINGATITGNVTVSAGITIDGRDLSVDGAALDAHIAATSGVHGVTGNVVGTSDSQTLTGKTIDLDSNTLSNIRNANVASDAAIARSKLASGTADHVLINDASGVMSSEARLSLDRLATGTANYLLTGQGSSSPAYGLLVNASVDAAAAIAVSKLAALTATRVVITDGSGFLSVSSRTPTELNYLEGAGAWASVTLADNTSNGAVASWASSIDAVWLQFSILRGTTAEAGFLFITHDGTNASVATFSATQGGLNGVTFDATVSGGNVNLRYTTTSTGSAATMNYNSFSRVVA